MPKSVVWVLLLVVGACSSNNTNKREDQPDIDAVEGDVGATEGDTDCGADCATADSGADLPPDSLSLPDRCVAGVTGWRAGTAAFENATERSGLAEIDAAGIRIATGDIDGDGYADLAIRRSGETNFETGERAVWLLRNLGDGSFEDVTRESGIIRARFATNANVGRAAEVFAFADVDNDGDLDVFTGFSNDGSNPEGSEIMLNEGDGTFVFGPVDTPFRRAGEPASVAGATWVDVDRDGWIDLWLGQGAVDRSPVSDALFVQRNGTFEDVTDEFGLRTEGWRLQPLNEGRAHTNAWSTAACDLDGDGNPELLASSYGRTPNKLWHAVVGDDGLRYVNHSIASGYAFDHRTDWTDNESARCWCMLHRDADDCDGVPAPTAIRCESDADAFRWNHATDREPYRLGGNSGTTVCGDIDNDGDLDLLTTEIVHWDVGSSSDPSELLVNQGDSPPTFERPGNDVTGLDRPEEGGSWDHGDITAALFDFDNDGRLDVYIGSTDYPGTRGHLFHQREDGTFQRVPLDDGFDHPRAHGVAVADFDRDGDLDLVIGHSTFRCDVGGDCFDNGHARYYENVIGQTANWVQLQLVGGEGSNASAIGARVTAETDELLQTSEVGGGHGHYGIQHDLVQHFGLGGSCHAEVTVRWPDAELTEQTFTLQAGYRYRVVQGEEPVAIIPDGADD